MSEQQVLVTGACGEIGQALVQELAKRGGYRIVTADFMPLPDSIKALSAEHVQGDLVYKIKTFYDYDFEIIFHLAASLSSKAEVATEEAHRINVEGTMKLLMLGICRTPCTAVTNCIVKSWGCITGNTTVRNIWMRTRRSCPTFGRFAFPG